MLKVPIKQNTTAGPSKPNKSNLTIPDGELTDPTYYLQTTTTHPLTHNTETTQTECSTTCHSSDSPLILCSPSTPEAEEAYQTPSVHQNSPTIGDPPKQQSASSSSTGTTTEGSKITLVNLHTKDGQKWLQLSVQGRALMDFKHIFQLQQSKRLVRHRLKDLTLIRTLADHLDLSLHLDKLEGTVWSRSQLRASLNNVSTTLDYNFTSDILKITLPNEHTTVSHRRQRKDISGAQIKPPETLPAGDPPHPSPTVAEVNKSFPSIRPKTRMTPPMKNLDLLLKTRTFGETHFPSEEVANHFLPSLQRFEVKKSPLIKKGSCGLGLFLRDDEHQINPSNDPIGVYSGRISHGKGVYHLDLSNGTHSLIIDGTPNINQKMTCFGRMNEDIFDNRPNVLIKKMVR